MSLKTKKILLKIWDTFDTIVSATLVLLFFLVLPTAVKDTETAIALVWMLYISMSLFARTRRR